MISTHITLSGNAPTFRVTRADRDETGAPVILSIEMGGDAVIEILIGDSHSLVTDLRDVLSDARIAADQILDNWVDSPDDSDGWINARGWRLFTVTLEGHHVGDYPTLSIAEMALAEVMVEKGTFPSCWYDNGSGPVACDDEIRRLHDEGGDRMKRHYLVGAQYEPGDGITVDGVPALVVRDCGRRGIVFDAGDSLSLWISDARRPQFGNVFTSG